MTASRKIRESIEKSSWIRKMFDEGNERKARLGAENVFDFSLGNPNLEPPSRFTKILKDLVNDTTPGRHGYMPNAGYVETRTAVANHLKASTGKDLTPDDIVMTVGACGALHIVFQTLLDPGREVIILAPFFVEYTNIIDTYQGISKIVSTKPDFSLDLDAIERAIDEKTKVVLINSPNNPTGKVYCEEDIKELSRVLSYYSEKNGEPIYLISDEPYRKIVFDGITFPDAHRN